MATKVAELVAELRLQSEAFERKLDGVQKQVKGARSDFAEMTNSVKAWGASFLSIEAGLRAMRFVAGVIMEAEQASARLQAVLKATGGTAGLTADEIKGLADAIERSTLFDDKEIMNASAVLATFRTVSGDTFRETIRLAADLSAVFGGDLQSSVTMLGKALEDPITGLSALRRVGVSFNDEQKGLITSLVESNDLLAAQREILKGVAIQVKGNAEAQGDTGLTGSLNLLKDAFENALEANLRFATEGKVPGWVEALADKIERIRFSLTQFLKLPGSFGLSLSPKGQPTSLTLPPALVTPGANIGTVGVTAPRTRTLTEEERKLQADLQRLSADLADQYQRDYERQQQSIRALGDAVQDVTEEEEKAYAKLVDGIREKFDAIAEVEKQLTESETAERWAKGWGMAIDGVAQSFEASIYGLVNRQIRTWRDFADQVLSIWANTLARMAAMQGGSAITGFLTTLVTSGLGAAFGGGPKSSGFVDSPIPGVGSPGATVSTASAPMVNVSLSVNAIDTRSGAEFLMQQIPTIKAAVAEAVNGDRGFARHLQAAGT